jgi:Flp pilus assembly protein TadD
MAHGNLGLALGNKGQHDEAIVEFREAIRLKPDFANAHSNLGLALLGQGKLDLAVSCYQKAIDLDPKLVMAFQSLIDALSRQGKLAEAIAVCEKYMTLYPDQALPINTFAWLLATSSDPRFRAPKRAVELARKAVELAPTEGTNRNTLGVALYRAGDWAAAIVALEKAETVAPDEHLALNGFFMAMAYWQMDQKGEARKWYGHAVQRRAKNQRRNEELRCFRAEAEELLGVTTEIQSKLAPATKSAP